MIQSDNFGQTGCYNLRCPGFVQTHPGFYLGYRANKTSTYGGEILEIGLSITLVMHPHTINFSLTKYFSFPHSYILSKYKYKFGNVVCDK